MTNTTLLRIFLATINLLDKQMNIPDLSLLREQLLNEIENLQAGITSINQAKAPSAKSVVDLAAKAVSNLANSMINSVLAELMTTKALPDNPHKEIGHDYIDIEKM